jgi:hypothetical protein
MFRTFVLSVIAFVVIMATLVTYVMVVSHADAAPLCPSLRADLARQDVVDVYDVDFIMHSAGCDQNEDGSWSKVKGSSYLDKESARCARRAYWLVNRGYSILRTRELLASRGCGQFEDGTYDGR